VTERDITAKLELDTSEAEKTEAEWQDRLTKLNREAQAVDKALHETVRKAARAAAAVGKLITVFAKVLPESLQSIVNAAVDLVTTAAVTLYTVATAYGSGGVTAPLAIAVSIAALAMSSMGMAAALDAQHAVDSATQAMVSDMMAVNQAINEIIGLLGGSF
jgi:hypothetical protein